MLKPYLRKPTVSFRSHDKQEHGFRGRCLGNVPLLQEKRNENKQHQTPKHNKKAR